MTPGPLLVSCGEASGDRAAAGVVRALPGVRAFGIGGPALEATGAALVADLRTFSSMGIGAVAPHMLSIAHAVACTVREVLRRRPRAALLVNFTEVNARLAAALHRRGVRVLWYVAPQIWAWREGRAVHLRRHIDRLAVVLPFEEPLWRAHGVDAHYVGHPVLETTALERPIARSALGLTPFAAAVALLPGSRASEVKRHLPLMLEAYDRVLRDHASIDGRLLLARSLDDDTRAFARALAEGHGVPVFDVDPAVGATAVLRAFDVSLCASGTASLEAMLAGAFPVVVCRVDPLTYLAGRALVRSEFLGLPNILLRRSVVPELIQDDATATRIAEELRRMLRVRARLLPAQAELVRLLGEGHRPSREVASMLAPWLGGAAALAS